MSYENNPPFVEPALEPIGGALETHGLTVKGAIYPLSALMFGLLWPCGDFWSMDSDPTNTWSATSSTFSTTWTATSSTSSTLWTEVNNGDC